MASKNRGTIKVLVVGEAGVGKSTLIGELRDPKRSPAPISGKAARGVTKEVLKYIGNPVNGRELVLYDTPGVGDNDVTPARLVSMVEDALKQEGPVNGIIVAHALNIPRLNLGCKVVQLLITKGFLSSGDAWKHVILAGTKGDKADEEDVDSFRQNLAPLFFKEAPGKKGTAVVVNWKNYSALNDAIRRLPAATVDWDPSARASIAADIAQKALGMEKVSSEKQAAVERQMRENAAEMDRMRAAMEAQRRLAASERQRADMMEEFVEEVMQLEKCPNCRDIAPPTRAREDRLCDVCDGDVPRHKEVMHCDNCGFDLCKHCFVDRVESIGFNADIYYSDDWQEKLEAVGEMLQSTLEPLEGLLERESVELQTRYGASVDDADDLEPSDFPLGLNVKLITKPLSSSSSECGSDSDDSSSS